jgi:osmoprotectant transport system permease protein
VNADSLIWWDWVGRHGTEIRAATFEHLRLTLLAVGIGFVLSMALAAVSLAWRPAFGPIVGVAGILYTIPSLALFSVLVTITGFTTLTAEIALVTYTLLILVRNIVEAIDGVPPDARDAATGMGYGPVRRFVAVELPLAVPTIVAAVRLATVTTVGLVTVAGLIGQGGYGALITSGLQRTFSTEIMVGAIGSVAMAIVLDLLLVGAERLATPWRRARADS